MYRQPHLSSISSRIATSVKADSRGLGLGYPCSKWFVTQNPETPGEPVSDKTYS